MKKKRFCAAIAAVLLLGLLVLCVFCDYPILLGQEVPEHYEETIRTQAEGIYSKRLPLIPVLVRIEACSAESIYYTIYYFPFGSVGMTYHSNDGYNIEKPLLKM